MVSIQQCLLGLGLAMMLVAPTARGEEKNPTLRESKGKFRADDPLVQEPTPLNVVKAKSRRIDDVYDFAYHSLVTPKAVEQERKSGDVRKSKNTNTLGEVPNSNWYTNRHWLQPMSLEELVRGPGNATPPADGEWMIVAAKSDGITPGFTIEDAKKQRYLLKFDPPAEPELATGADVVGSKFFYALGYFTPENYIVEFATARLRISPEASYQGAGGKKLPLTMRRVMDILRGQPRDEKGNLRAMASRLIDGQVIGPFRYQGMRTDDPNDILPHEDRRELRGLRLFAAWLNHTDTRAINSLDVIVKDGAGSYIRHHLIDFGATLGSDSVGAKLAPRGHVFDVDRKETGKQIVTFGLMSPKWQRVSTPRIQGVGRFEAVSFDPRAWQSAYPNPAFMRMDEEDAVWAAKQIARFTDGEIRAIVKTGVYSDPRAAEYIAQTLIARRDRIVAAYLTNRLVADHFRMTGNILAFDWAGKPPRYSMSWSEFDNEKGEFSGWTPGDNTVPNHFGSLEQGRFIAARLLKPSESGVEEALNVYLRRTTGGWQVTGVERALEAGGKR